MSKIAPPTNSTEKKGIPSYIAVVSLVLAVLAGVLWFTPGLWRLIPLVIFFSVVSIISGIIYLLKSIRYKYLAIVGIIISLIMISMFVYTLTSAIKEKNIQNQQQGEYQKYYEGLIKLKGTYNATETQIRAIEAKYMIHGMVSFSEFSTEDLKVYLPLIDGQIENLDNIKDYVISNENLLKENGYTDLGISEWLEEIKQLREEYFKIRGKVAPILIARETQ